MEPIQITKAAYDVAAMFTKDDWRPFPSIDDKDPIRNTLMKKNILERRGGLRDSTYRLVVDIADLQPYEKKTKTPKQIKSVFEPARVSLPVSRGGHLPTFYLLDDFIEEVDNESKALYEQMLSDLTAKIKRTKIALNNTSNLDQEYQLEKELHMYMNDRRKAANVALIQAIKEVEARKKYRAYNWDNIVSKNPADYAEGALT